MSFDAQAEIEKIKRDLDNERERASRREIIERQRATMPPKNAAGKIPIGPGGALERAEGVIVNGKRFMDELRLVTGWGGRE
jgi:hypothetical protein